MFGLKPEEEDEILQNPRAKARGNS